MKLIVFTISDEFSFGSPTIICVTTSILYLFNKAMALVKSELE